ncbi:hypothetical protein JW935_07710, partial [candidate division KSB1 bacterium]|nr:hypothetical protein [candidate division KSB1 bacterium]
MFFKFFWTRFSKTVFTQCIIALFSFFIVVAAAPLSAAENTNKLIVNIDEGKETISRHIYGHFSEHLGHC